MHNSESKKAGIKMILKRDYGLRNIDVDAYVDDSLNYRENFANIKDTFINNAKNSEYLY